MCSINETYWNPVSHCDHVMGVGLGTREEHTNDALHMLKNSLQLLEQSSQVRLCLSLQVRGSKDKLTL